MAIIEKRVLKSVEILPDSDAVNVCWEDQVIKNGEIIAATPFRRAYSKPDKELFVEDLGNDSANYIAALGW